MCLDSMTLVNVNLLSSEGQQLVQGEVNGEEVGGAAPARENKPRGTGFVLVLVIF